MKQVSVRLFKKALAISGLIASGRFDLICYKFSSAWHGLDLTRVDLDELGVQSKSGFWYSDSGGPDLARVFKSLCVPVGSRALDLGCGKGGAVLTLSKFPFREIVGVEISPELVKIAQENARKLGIKNTRFVCSDAKGFTDLDSFSYIYMYNPFPAEVMGPVLENLRQSLFRKPRSLTVVYKNSVCHELLAKSGLFGHLTEHSFRKSNHPFRIYQHVSADLSRGCDLRESRL